MTGTGITVPKDGRAFVGATNINGIDNKKVAVGKLPENLDKSGFRHWIQAVDLQPEVIHRFRYTEQVLDQIKRSKVEIAATVLVACLETVNLGIDSRIDSMGFDTTTDWEYKDKSLFLYAYFINKINVDLYDKMAGIADKNGFELYRQIFQLADAVPGNAMFHMSAELSAMVQNSGGED